MAQAKSADMCCPPFDTARWDKKTQAWKDKLFVEDRVTQFMHIPLNMGQVVKRMFATIEAAKAAPDTKDFLMLCYDPSPWQSEIYMTVTKKVPGIRTTTLSGKFLSRVFDGPYHAVPKWLKQMEADLAAKKQKALKYYIHYAYCPKCAKKYGHNYGVVFAKVE